MRGFLRSYSQYLGLDPKEALALYPRDEEPSPYHAGGTEQPQDRRAAQPQQPATVGGPPHVAASLPAGTGAAAPAAPATGAGAARGRAPARRPAAAPQQTFDAAWEPTIGVDIGIPAPARRIKTDPAAQARSMTVLIVAATAIIAVVVLAVAISRLGGGGGNAARSRFAHRPPPPPAPPPLASARLLPSPPRKWCRA